MEFSLLRRNRESDEFENIVSGGGDGIAVDAAGRLYVTTNPGVQVLSPAGDCLGLIPNPRPSISLTFSGTQQKTLYVDSDGAVGPEGKVYEVPEGQRNKYGYDAIQYPDTG